MVTTLILGLRLRIAKGSHLAIFHQKLSGSVTSRYNTLASDLKNVYCFVSVVSKNYKRMFKIVLYEYIISG